MINYQKKYLKYKNKYLNLKNQLGGNDINQILDKIYFSVSNVNNNIIDAKTNFNIIIIENPENNKNFFEQELTYSNIFYSNMLYESIKSIITNDRKIGQTDQEYELEQIQKTIKYIKENYPQVNLIIIESLIKESIKSNPIPESKMKVIKNYLEQIIKQHKIVVNFNNSELFILNKKICDFFESNIDKINVDKIPRKIFLNNYSCSWENASITYMGSSDTNILDEIIKDKYDSGCRLFLFDIGAGQYELESSFNFIDTINEWLKEFIVNDQIISKLNEKICVINIGSVDDNNIGFKKSIEYNVKYVHLCYYYDKFFEFCFNRAKKYDCKFIFLDQTQANVMSNLFKLSYDYKQYITNNKKKQKLVKYIQEICCKN
jgi:hypothetical protein